MITVLMTAFYTTRMWTLVFLGTPRSKGAEHAHEAPASMRFSLIVLAGLTVIAGFVLVPVLSGMQWGNANDYKPVPIGFIGLGLAVVGIIWGYRMYAKAPADEPLKKLGWVYTGMVNLWWVDAFFTWLAHRVVLVLGSKVRQFDKQVIDGGFVDGTAWLTGRFGYLLRRIGAGPKAGHLQYYALVIFLLTALVVLAMAFGGIFPDLFPTAQMGVTR
jgi:NADH-quinone oxidoreductase subunit L